MARFFLTARNGRGNETSVGGRTSVEQAHIRGWNAGIKVSTNHGEKGQPDELAVYMTGGSNGHTTDRLLGYVRDTPDGPVFTPAWPGAHAGNTRAFGLND